MKTQKFTITGMSCSACSSHVESAVTKLKGVSAVNVNLLANSMNVNYDEKIIDEKEIINAVVMAGYGAKAFNTNDDLYNSESNKTKIRLIWSVIFLIALMVVAMGHMFGLHLFYDMFIQGIAELILLTPIIILNKKYFISGTKSIFKLAPNMDTLIALGAGVSILYSIYNMVLYQTSGNSVHYYFESAGMILTFITIGKFLESKSKSKTSSAIKELIELTPKTAILEIDGTEKFVQADEIRQNDVVICKNGMSIPVDGKIIFGNCSVDESAITGESIPVDKTIGCAVTGGTVINSGYIKILAEKTGSDTALSEIIKLVEESTNSKAPIARIADKVASFFVPAVIAISIVTTIIWLIAGADFESAISFGIAVLVISCPCALGLATPTAIMVGTGKAAQNGILIKSAVSLETANKIKTVILDKTGTITKGKPQVTDVISYIDEDEFLKIALSLENNSEHPLSRAVVEYCKAKSISILETYNFKSLTGSGISGEINGVKYYGGNLRFIKSIGINFESNFLTKLYDSGKTPLFFADNNRIIGIIAVADTIKETSKDAISKLNAMGIETIMLTGDNKQTAKTVQKKVGIRTAYAEVLPHQKEEIIRRYKEKGNVAMVGDGINDSPALVSANVGIAIGAGTDIAIDSADIVLMRSDLSDVVTTIQLSKAVLKNIKENLFWAFIYNIIGIPLAAGAFYTLLNWQLQPMFGTIAMSLSSICVVSNALRLKKFKPHKITFSKKSINNYETIVLESEEKKMKTVIIEGIMCPHCQARVQEVLSKLSNDVVVNLEEKTATLADTVSNQSIIDAITNAGYKVIEIK